MSDMCHRTVWEGELDKGKNTINSQEWMTVEAGCWIHSDSLYSSILVSYK